MMPADHRRPRPDRAGARESRRQRARRHAERRRLTIRTSDAWLDEGWSTVGSTELVPGPHVVLEVADTGHRHGRGDAAPRLRAVLHDEGRRAAAPASASRRCTASSSRWAARSRSRASRTGARRSGLYSRRRPSRHGRRRAGSVDRPRPRQRDSVARRGRGCRAPLSHAPARVARLSRDRRRARDGRPRAARRRSVADRSRHQRHGDAGRHRDPSSCGCSARRGPGCRRSSSPATRTRAAAQARADGQRRSSCCEAVFVRPSCSDENPADPRTAA